MDDFESTPELYAEGKSGNAIALFLGLYLLVLAFFILLVTISTREEIRSKAVMDSLTSAFSDLLPPSTDLTYFTAKEGDVVAGYAFQQDITAIFATAIPVANIKIIQPGRLMTVTMPAESLFFSNESRFRGGKTEFLNRIVTALSARPKGVRFDLEFILTSTADNRGFIPKGETLSRSRAGVFARELTSKGAPPDSVSVGLRAGKLEEITIFFYVRDIDELPSMLKQSFESGRI